MAKSAARSQQLEIYLDAEAMTALAALAAQLTEETGRPHSLNDAAAAAIEIADKEISLTRKSRRRKTG
ncbi:MAG: hypothetical protein JO270_19440 [Acidobacteriaceae bacterium]|nr:hypothetical protein [Acidobacteriaceae bacterium]